MHELDSPVSIAFLRRYATSASARRLTGPRLEAFLHRIGYCGRKPAAEPLTRVTEAPQAGIGQVEAEGRAVCVLALLDAVEVANSRARELEAEVVEQLSIRADREVFASLPRAGRGVRAGSLLAEIGDVRERSPDEERLVTLAGVAAVTRASGTARSVGFRWACDKKLRNAQIGFADDTRHASPWAARVYSHAITPGKRHPHAAQILARACVRVIWRM